MTVTKKYVLYAWTEGLCGFYCGYWSQYWGMEQYPILIDSLEDNSTYKSKQLKTYSSYGRALNGAKACIGNIGMDWFLKIVSVEDIDTEFMIKRLNKRRVPVYDPHGNPIPESLNW